MRFHKSKEEKIALKLSDLVNDYTLDIEEVGRYFYKVAPLVSYNRVLEIVEVAQIEKENNGKPRTTTTFMNKCNILANLWISYRDDQEFKDFIQYNDLGLPLAFAISENIAKSSDKTEMFIDETFELLLTALNLEDKGFESLDELLESEA